MDTSCLNLDLDQFLYIWDPWTNLVQTVKSPKGLSRNICPREVSRDSREVSRDLPWANCSDNPWGLFTACQTLGFKNRRKWGPELLKYDSVESRLWWLEKQSLTNLTGLDRILTNPTVFYPRAWLTVLPYVDGGGHNRDGAMLDAGSVDAGDMVYWIMGFSVLREDVMFLWPEGSLAKSSTLETQSLNYPCRLFTQTHVFYQFGKYIIRKPSQASHLCLR